MLPLTVWLISVNVRAIYFAVVFYITAIVNHFCINMKNNKRVGFCHYGIIVLLMFVSSCSRDSKGTKFELLDKYQDVDCKSYYSDDLGYITYMRSLSRRTFLYVLGRHCSHADIIGGYFDGERRYKFVNVYNVVHLRVSQLVKERMLGYPFLSNGEMVVPLYYISTPETRARINRIKKQGN